MLAAVSAVPCAATGSVCSDSCQKASPGRRFALPCRRTSWRANPSFITGFCSGWRSKALYAVAPSNAKTVTVQPRAQEQTYVMIKPDGVQRGLVGEIISRFERKGFQLKGLKLFKCPEDLAKKHYEELQEKPFFPKLVKYIISGPVVCMVWEGPGVVASARKLIGSTNPLQAEPGTIRGDLGIEVGRNVVHGSDSPTNGGREIALWFREDELYEWQQEMTPWLRE